jgi:hypothetical protein
MTVRPQCVPILCGLEELLAANKREWRKIKFQFMFVRVIRG